MRISDWSSDVCSSDLFERQWCAAVHDSIDIGPANAGKAGVPVSSYALAVYHSHGQGTHFCVKCFHQPEGRNVFLNVQMRPHRDTMNARVRAPRRMNPRALARYGMGGVFNGLLNAWSMRLPLPAHARPTLEFDGTSEARQGINTPRSEKRSI